jgi:hypothetical protein
VAVPTHQQTLFDLVSRGRKGPGGRIRLSPGQMEEVARTVRKVPEVIVKVSGGARDSGGAKAHFDYIDRHGKLELHTDDGREIVGKDAAAELVDDWNLDLSKGQYRPPPAEGEKDTRPKVVHNIVLSMPGRTPPEAVLEAAKKFARENFALQYRYAMVLHTDQSHPHVHLVVKAEHEYEPGKRLYIRKATLQQWREDFAVALREQGVAANATPRQIRGENRSPKKDPIHQRLKDLADYERLPGDQREKRRAPVDSTFMRRKVEQVARDLRAGEFAPEPGKAKLVQTREAVKEGWLATAATLRAQGEDKLAAEVESFVKAMPGARTDREMIAAGLLAQVKAQRRRGLEIDLTNVPKKRGS